MIGSFAGRRGTEDAALNRARCMAGAGSDLHRPTGRSRSPSVVAVARGPRLLTPPPVFESLPAPLLDAFRADLGGRLLARKIARPTHHTPDELRSRPPLDHLVFTLLA